MEAIDIFQALFQRDPRGVQIYRGEDLSDPGALRLVAQNQAASDLTGVDMSVMVDRTIRDAHPEYLESEFPARYLRVLTTQEPDEWEVTYSDATFREAVWRARVIPLDRQHLAVLFENVTAEHRATRELLERTQEAEEAKASLEALASRVSADLGAAEARFAAVLDQVPALVWSVDRELRVLTCSGSAIDRLGQAGLEELGLAMGQVVGGEVAEHPAVAPHRAALAGETVDTRSEVNGRLLEGRLSPLTSPDGSIIGVVGVGVDATESRELEARMRQAQRLESVGRLAGGIAHDFNNLLTVVQNHARFIEKRGPGGNGAKAGARANAESLELIRRATAHGTRLTTQLLAFASRQVVRPTPLDLNEVIREFGGMFRHVLGDDIEVTLRPEAKDGAVLADRGQLEQILMNLTLNARDAMREGGALEIATSRVEVGEGNGMSLGVGPFVRLAVSDTGVGMEPETLARVFEPFYTTKRTSGGTGLGLSTVYGAVQQQGGAVHVESTPGAGTRFEILFPVSGEKPSVPRPPETPTPTRLAGTVLVADDHHDVRGVIIDILKGTGLCVLDAEDAKAALALAEAHAGPIDVAVLDVVMPHMSGPALAERLSERFPGIRVVFTTGYAAEDRGQLTGWVVNKPFSSEVLLRAVRDALLERAREGHGKRQRRC